ncbi:MAG: 2-amino-4-hydroxy-6-hydroxymethyldihydropteridine diphosphokinase [Pseudomonadota bacterium]
MVEAAIGLGANLGDRRANIEWACDKLSALPGTQMTRRSALYETPPWGDLDQPAFINACLLIETQIQPEDLLQHCLAIEQEMGRVRTRHWGPRLIDIDLLWLDDHQVSSPTLTLPHPEIQNRAFVLVPLNEIAPDKVINAAGRSLTVRDWLAETDARSIKRLDN